MNASSDPLWPSELRCSADKKYLSIRFENGDNFTLSAELLRVESPSAEVQGHHPSQAVLQIGKENVNILKISPVGQYAIKLHFSDSHDTGIYSWAYLYKLAKNYDQLWMEYIMKLDESGVKRKVDDSEQ